MEHSPVHNSGLTKLQCNLPLIKIIHDRYSQKFDTKLYLIWYAVKLNCLHVLARIPLTNYYSGFAKRIFHSPHISDIAVVTSSVVKKQST